MITLRFTSDYLASRRSAWWDLVTDDQATRDAVATLQGVLDRLRFRTNNEFWDRFLGEPYEPPEPPAAPFEFMPFQRDILRAIMPATPISPPSGIITNSA